MFALELVDVRKRFGSLVALDGASLQVRAGSVHAVLGENGAGKTTLVRVAAGELRPDQGLVQFEGQPVSLRGPADAIARGVGMVHQHFALVPAMTVAENIMLGMRSRFDPAAAVERVRALGEATGLRVDPRARLRNLSVAAQQRVEILKALARDVRLLILDEPTAVLAPAESDELLAWLRRLADTGVSIVLISHRLREVRGIADELTVLRAGRTVATHRTIEVTDPTLVTEMVGEAPSDSGSKSAMSPGPVILALTNVDVRGSRITHALHEISLEVRRGEIVGIAAVEGSGHRELVRVLAGRLPITRGQRRLPSRVGFIPEDRHRDAVVLPMTLTENVALRDLAGRRGRMPWKDLTSRTLEIIREFDVRATSPRVPVSTLSGGNQQRLVVGRELSPAPEVIVAENPTRGLDVRAAVAVRDHLRSARAGGCGVIMYSTDIEELLTLADRIVVVYAGRLREMPANRDAIGRAMLGASVP
jgi:simple sugar transport system ATP-binding protein